MGLNIRHRLHNYLQALKQRKTLLDGEIQNEMGKSIPCSWMLQKLKKQRLNIKDRMNFIGHIS